MTTSCGGLGLASRGGDTAGDLAWATLTWQPGLMTMDASLGEKRQNLRATLKALDRVLVSFSGGVDSTYLLAEAVDVLGDRAQAFIADSPSLPRAELAAALALAQGLGIDAPRIVATHELEIPEYVENPPNRCYFCKQEMMREALAVAATMASDIASAGTTTSGGASAGEGAEPVVVLVGTNVDDLGGHLPGLAAVKEAGARMPLVEAGLTKAEIRALSAAAGLPTADKPEQACLASRVPTGRRISAARLRRIEDFEGGLAALGFSGFRVRFHEPIARIEVAAAQLARAVEEETREAIVALGRRLGFRFVTLDLQGYRRGSLSEEEA